MENRDLRGRVAALEEVMRGLSPTDVTDDELIEALRAGTATMKHVRWLFKLMGEELRAKVLVSAAALRSNQERDFGFRFFPVDVAIAIVGYPVDEPVAERYTASVFRSCGYDPESWDRAAKNFAYRDLARNRYFANWVKAEMIRLLFRGDPTARKLRTQLDTYAGDFEAVCNDLDAPPRDLALRLHSIHEPLDDSHQEPLMLGREQYLDAFPIVRFADAAPDDVKKVDMDGQ